MIVDPATVFALVEIAHDSAVRDLGIDSWSCKACAQEGEAYELYWAADGHPLCAYCHSDEIEAR